MRGLSQKRTTLHFVQVGFSQTMDLNLQTHLLPEIAFCSCDKRNFLFMIHLSQEQKDITARGGVLRHCGMVHYSKQGTYCQGRWLSSVSSRDDPSDQNCPPQVSAYSLPEGISGNTFKSCKKHGIC